MNIANRMAGAAIGVLTGLVTAVLQIPYAYYLFAKNRRAAGNSYFTTLLATVTIGSLVVCLVAFLAIFTFWGHVGWGIKVGWSKGMTGAIKLPYIFHIEFQKRIPIYCKDIDHITFSPKGTVGNLVKQLEALALSSVDYLFNNMDYEGNMFFSNDERRILDLLHEHRHLLLLHQMLENERVARLQGNMAQAEQYAMAATNFDLQWMAQNQTPEVKNLLQKINSSPKTNNITLLNEEEIEVYKKIIQKLPEKEQKQKKENLLDYQDRINCPITLEPSDKPITAILPRSERTRTYDENALKLWIEAKKQNIREPHSNVYKLIDLRFYKGYPLRVVDFINQVREINKECNEKLENEVAPAPAVPYENHAQEGFQQK